MRHHWGDLLVRRCFPRGRRRAHLAHPVGSERRPDRPRRASHWVAIPFVALGRCRCSSDGAPASSPASPSSSAVAVLGIIDPDATDAIVLFVIVLAASAAIGLHEDRRRAIAGGVVALVALLVLIRASERRARSRPTSSSGSSSPGAARRRPGRAEHDTAERAARGADGGARANSGGAGEAAVAAEERTRIANELHNVIAQGVSMMTVQASGARMLLRTDRDRAREAILAVEEAGREALDRDPPPARDHATATRPSRSSRRSPASRLAAGARRARGCRGLPVRLEIEGEPQHAPRERAA